MNIPEHLQRELGVASSEVVTFVQQSAEAFRYRDAVRFANGREILLQRLSCGQRVEVLALESAEQPETAASLIADGVHANASV